MSAHEKTGAVTRERGTRPVVRLLLAALGVALIAARITRDATPAGLRQRRPQPREPKLPSFAEQLSEVRTRPGVAPTRPHSGNGHANEGEPTTHSHGTP